MGHHQNRSPEILQVIFQPPDHGTVQMVSGLIQKQHIKILCQHLSQSHFSLLAAGELLNRRTVIHNSQLT